MLPILRPKTNSYGGTISRLLQSTKLYKVWNLFFPDDQPNSFYKGNGLDAFANLLPFQTAVKDHTAVLVAATKVMSGAELRAGSITSLSAAAVTYTTLTAALMATALRAKANSWYDFSINNIGGANTITLVGGTNVTAITAVLTGAATLTVAAGTVGIFRFYFSTDGDVKIARIV